MMDTAKTSQRVKITKSHSDLICNHLGDKERAGCFAFIVFWMACHCKCYVALPHSAVGWSAVCDCGISDHSHLILTVGQDGI